LSEKCHDLSMNILGKIVNYGIGKHTSLLDSVRIRNKNIVSIIISCLFLLAGILGLLFGLTVLSIITLVSFIFFTAISLIFSHATAPKTAGHLVLILPSISGLAIYFLEPEISGSVLIFLMLFPIIAVSMVKRNSINISLALLFFIIAGNFIPLENGFMPLEPLSFIFYIVGYGVMLTMAEIIRKNIQQRISEQIEKVEYYESEIKQRDEFISNLSHKLRTSLSNITLINNLVHDARMSTAQKELLDTLKTSTLDLINDVNELVEISTPTILDYKQSILSFNLEDALKGTIDILESDRKLKQKISIEWKASLQYNIIGDPSLLRSILINLSRGIAELEPIHDEIRLTISTDYETQSMYGLKIELAFNLHQSQKLEEKFRELQKNGEGQSNLFTIANRLLTLTGGKLNIESKDNGHSVFFYQDFSKDLTRKTESEESDVKMIKTQERKLLSESNILLVEDNTINQKIVLLSLDKVVKNIDVANNGKEALDMFGTKKYDAILMDIQMPVMDGITATKKMREIEATTEERVPIIAITANALSGDRDNCLAAGADDYLSKPFQVEELVKRITNLLSRV